jgi:hypothetical protein
VSQELKPKCSDAMMLATAKKVARAMRTRASLRFMVFSVALGRWYR